MELQRWLGQAVGAFHAWAREYEEYAAHPAMAVDEDARASAFAELSVRLRGSYPFFHPCYAGQMLKPPHPVAVAGYLAAILVNSNNHALDGGPATSAMEEEVVEQLAAMFGLRTHMGHLTSGGTLANLEALFVARESHPGRGIAISAEAHYTHARMSHLLGMRVHTVPVDVHGRMDTGALGQLLSTGDIGTVVATTGTTALGAVDPLHLIVPLARRHGARVHVDAAYGGFFTLLADEEHGAALVTGDPWRAVTHCDSVVIDPHKHGLQPYGCGAVIFSDPAVARFYRHDSPYTYFTSQRPHLGEISLECSRSGASAAALWLTLKLLPLTRRGLGAVLAAGRRAALRWAELIDESPVLELYQRPELDIVTYHPRTTPAVLSRIGVASNDVMQRGMNAKEDPVFLSVARIGASDFTARHGEVTADRDHTHILRSVLMKPESELYLERLHSRVEHLARASIRHA
ncbi:pyridoxal phosphate-dependent decarboxylase family protein [Streptomyces albireticuli]|uniref:Aspartate aminotransferase family protein n=1 Tax=Streptomyces albireticuli TaxID=1940 RepID=A0A2A2D683_9ACTN|nr:aminotransferase class V-fold PLP-dependent enzyme [Streptomyces albireticuli]MCD9195170.1 aminotransferase class V-fold PLP-dependent enzyme [Streptomyces albireticuli]PAU47021.1 aspartate aminotransferase family protein [Streptomyces albireticuli]